MPRPPSSNRQFDVDLSDKKESSQGSERLLDSAAAVRAIGQAHKTITMATTRRTTIFLFLLPFFLTIFLTGEESLSLGPSADLSLPARILTSPHQLSNVDVRTYIFIRYLFFYPHQPYRYPLYQYFKERVEFFFLPLLLILNLFLKS